MTEPHRHSDPLRRILRRTRAALLLEQVARAFWPLASFLAVLWATLAFGLAGIASRGQLIAVFTLAAAVALWLLVRGLRQFRWPSENEARARIDADLPGRPLAALQDRPALGEGDAAARAVWAAHLARMRRLALAARPARPDLRLASRDPFGLRLMALVVLIAAGLFAGSDRIRGVGAALAPSGATAVAQGPSFEGWVVPPAYTGRPTLYLPEIAGETPVPVPTGSEITLRGYGEAERFALHETVSESPVPQALDEAAPGIAAAAFPVARSGTVTLREGRETLGAWPFAAEPDEPPSIALTGPVERAPTGEMQLAYEAQDDYGVTAARVEITRDLAATDRRYGLAVEPATRPALVVELPLPMTGGGAEVAETLVEDFSKHPFAGLPVTLTLTAEDALGQTGASGPEAAILPGRRFYDPVAAALIEQRRDLLWSPGNARRVEQVLRAVTHRPERVFDNPRAYLLTRTAVRRLPRLEEGESLEEVAELLWQAALLIEEGGLGDAAERLAQARERLSQALRSDATDAEIAQLMEELREATRNYMEQMAREAIERGETQSAEAPPPGQTMTQDQIQELMDRIQELSEQGRRAEAEALLDMLQQLLENMEMRLAEGGEGQGGPGQQAMQGLSDALREQQDLADESFQQLQREFNQSRPGQGGQPGDGQRGEGAPDPNALADRQEALRQLMDQLQQGLPGAAGEAAREALRQAERDMGAARDGLAQGDTAEALDRQADAIERMREGMRQMSEDMRQAESGGAGEPGDEDETAQGGTDPLGRPTGSGGNVGTQDSMLPEADAAARARALLDEIRRRSGDQARPQIELDYLRRLLDRF